MTNIEKGTAGEYFGLDLSQLLALAINVEIKKAFTPNSKPEEIKEHKKELLEKYQDWWDLFTTGSINRITAAQLLQNLAIKDCFNELANSFELKPEYQELAVSSESAAK